MYILSRELHALPQSGGLFDQDWLHMEIFGIIAHTWISEENRRNAQKVQQR
jgi:hypothetical protein